MAYVGETRSLALIAELESHGIGECVVCGELPARRTRSLLLSPVLRGVVSSWRLHVKERATFDASHNARRSGEFPADARRPTPRRSRRQDRSKVAECSQTCLPGRCSLYAAAGGRRCGVLISCS